MAPKRPKRNREEPEGDLRPRSYRKNRIEEQRIKELLEEDDEFDHDHRDEEVDGS